MNIQWYPGHMKKALNVIKDNLQLIDVIVEILDARIPAASSNPSFEELFRNKERIIILNKSDIADEKLTDEWIAHFKEKNTPAIAFSAKNGKKSKVIKAIEKVSVKVNKKLTQKGRKTRPVRVMVIGVPNSGKSSFINMIVGRNITRTANKPGVTRGKQWIKINDKIELFDTPGILWPKFDDQNTAMLLSMCSAIDDNRVDLYHLSIYSLDIVIKNYPGYINKRFNVSEDNNLEQILMDIGAARGCLLKKNQIDIDRTSKLLIEEIRNAKLGKMTFERPLSTKGEE